MDRGELLELLRRGREGVLEWNRLRESGASLPALRGVELRNVNLGDADLHGADLRRADLYSAALFRANLDGADLSGANVVGVNMSGASLRSAVLRKADMRGVNLTRAKLDGADFHEARFGYTTIGPDITGARGLDSVVHAGPTEVAVQALLNLPDPAPEQFLEQCGIPIETIGHFTARQGAIRLHDCFISYSSMDEEFARRLYDMLQREGVRCWFAPEDLEYGERILDGVYSAIRLREKVVLVVSEASLASGCVEDEVVRAFAEERERGTTVLVPVRIDDAIEGSASAWATKIRDDRNVGDFTGWKDPDSFEASSKRLLRALRKK